MFSLLNLHTIGFLFTEGSIDKDKRQPSSAAMRGHRGGLPTSIPMHKARAMAHGFLDRVGGPFNETRDGSGLEDCNCYKRPAMAERRSTNGELPGRSWYMARVSPGVYLPQLEQAASKFLPHARKLCTSASVSEMERSWHF
jgi:hypothetical protein